MVWHSLPCQKPYEAYVCPARFLDLPRAIYPVHERQYYQQKHSLRCCVSSSILAFIGPGQLAPFYPFRYPHERSQRIVLWNFYSQIQWHYYLICHLVCCIIVLLFLFHLSYIIQQKTELFYTNFSVFFGLLLQQPRKGSINSSLGTGISIVVRGFIRAP